MSANYSEKEITIRIKRQLQRISGQKGWKISKGKASKPWLSCAKEADANDIVDHVCSLGLDAKIKFTVDGHKPIVILEEVMLAQIENLPDYKSFSLRQTDPIAISSIFINVSQSATGRLDILKTAAEVNGIFTAGLTGCLCLIAASPSGRRFSLTHTATAVDIQPIISECEWTGKGSRLYLIKGSAYDDPKANFELMDNTSLMKKLASLSKEYSNTIIVDKTYFDLPAYAVAISRSGELQLFNKQQHDKLCVSEYRKKIQIDRNYSLRNTINQLNTLTAQTILKGDKIYPNDAVQYHSLDLQYDSTIWTPLPQLADRLLHFFNHATDIKKAGDLLSRYVTSYKELLSDAENQIKESINPEGLGHYKQKNYREAATLFEEGLALLNMFYPIYSWIERSDFPTHQLGESAKLIASLHNNLGRMYQYIRDTFTENPEKIAHNHQIAVTHLRKSYEIKRELFGENHESTQKAKAKYQEILIKTGEDELQQTSEHESASKATQKKGGSRVAQKAADSGRNSQNIKSPDDLRQAIVKMRFEQRMSGIVGTKVDIKVATVEKMQILMSMVHERITTSNDVVSREEHPYYHSHPSVPIELHNFKRKLSVIRTAGSGIIADIGHIPASDGGARWNDLSRESFFHSLVGTLVSSAYGIGDCSECSTLLFIEMLKNGYGNLAFISIKFVKAEAGMDQAHQLIVANLPNVPKPANPSKVTIDDLFNCLPRKALIVDPFLNLCFKPTQVPDDFRRYINVYGGQTEIIQCFHLSNFAPRMIRAYEMAAEFVVAQLKKLHPEIKHYNHYPLEDKIELESETSVIGWLKHSTQLPFFAVRDKAYKVDAVVPVMSEHDQEACRELNQDLQGYGRFFNDFAGKPYFVVEGVNITNEELFVGELIRSMVNK